ncbi:MAG TPA: hypothetical protein VGG29_01355 [Caulobacteraceae bacterium]|jgi:hypothetical protein
MLALSNPLAVKVMFRTASFSDAAGAIAVADDVTLQFLMLELIQSGVLPADRALDVLDRSIAYHERVRGRGKAEDAAVRHLLQVRSLLADSLAAVGESPQAQDAARLSVAEEVDAALRKVAAL